MARRDCRVRDKGQVVAEHRATHDRRYAERQVETGGCGHGNRNGRDERDGSHRGSHGERNEAAHDEQDGHRKLRRNEREHEVCDAFGAVAAYGAYEYAGCHEDENHGDDRLIANAAAHDGQLVIEVEFAILETCHQKRHKEDYDDGNAVKAHLDLQDVLEENSQAQVKHKEYPDRSKRPKVTFFHFDYSSLFA